MKKLATLTSLAILAVGAQAVTINFEEFAADDANGGMPAGRYAHLGVTFNATDDGTTWGGNSNGNPGNWGLEGTNGAQFAGFNGDSYGLGMEFSTDINGFSLDVSRSNGSQAGDTFTLEGLDGGSVIESHTITLGDINTWSTVSLSSTVDEVRLSGNGLDFHPYGVDNINWNVVPEPATMAALGLGLLAMRRRRK